MKIWNLLAALGICVMLSSCFDSKVKEEAVLPEPQGSGSIDADTLPRKSITFILGKDERGKPPYYVLANHYYRLSETEKTEIVIDSLISLLQVRNYLANHRPENGRPWGLVNLVSHGNEFINLSVYISPTGARVSEQSLIEAIRDTVLVPLDSLTIDKKTLFNIHGCAVGNNTALLSQLAKALGGPAHPAKVKASKMFEYYAYLSGNKNPQMIRHYYARVWYAYYNPDSFPGEEALVNQLSARYPAETLNWEEALQRQHPSNPSQPYHMEIKIPVVWEDFYKLKEELPNLNTKAKQKKFLTGKTEFLGMMNRTRIPEEYFRIKFYRLIYTEGVDTIYSNKVKAMTTAMCIISPVLDKSEEQTIKYPPFVPAAEDSVYFGFSK